MEELRRNPRFKIANPYEGLLRKWEHQINVHFRQFYAKSQDHLDNEYIGQRTINRSFSEIYGPKLATSHEEGGLDVIEREYHSMSLRQGVMEYWKQETVRRDDDGIQEASPRLLRDTEIVSEVKTFLIPSRQRLRQRELKALEFKLTRDEAKYLREVLGSLHKENVQNLWGCLIDKMGGLPSWERMKEYRQNLSNLRPLSADQHLSRALLFSRLARTMYSAYWFHAGSLSKDASIRQSRLGIQQQTTKLMKRLSQQRGMLKTLLNSEPSEILGVRADGNSTRNVKTLLFLRSWVGHIGQPERAFSEEGRRLLHDQEVRVKTKSRSRLESRSLTPRELREAVENASRESEFEYSYRFRRAVTIAYDISEGLRRKKRQ
jgi:hypothetical protein